MCMCVRVSGWVGGCAHWQRQGQGVKKGAAGDGRASPSVTMMKLGAGGGSAQCQFGDSL